MLKNILKSNKHKDLDLNNEYHEEYQYINLIKDILNEGTSDVWFGCGRVLRLPLL